MHESEKWKWSRSVVSDSWRPMDCSPPGSSVHGIFQARVLEWGAIAFSVISITQSQIPGDLQSSSWLLLSMCPVVGNLSQENIFQHWHVKRLRSCQPLPYKMDFPGDSDGKESASNASDLGSILGSGRSPGEGNGYSCLENSMDREAWRAIAHGVPVRHDWATNTFTFLIRQTGQTKSMPFLRPLKRTEIGQTSRIGRDTHLIAVCLEQKLLDAINEQLTTNFESCWRLCEPVWGSSHGECSHDGWKCVGHTFPVEITDRVWGFRKNPHVALIATVKGEGNFAPLQLFCLTWGG